MAWALGMGSASYKKCKNKFNTVGRLYTRSIIIVVCMVALLHCINSNLGKNESSLALAGYSTKRR